LHVASATSSVQFVINADGTYTLTVLDTTSAVTANETLETGTWVQSGGYLIFTPVKASCPASLPIGNSTYSFNGTDLVLDDIVYASTAPETLGSGLTLVVGCTIAGTFTASPLAPVATTGTPIGTGTVGEPSIYGTWLDTVTPDGITYNLQTVLNSDCTYQLTVFNETSNATGNETIETGTFALNGANITFTELKATCPGNVTVGTTDYFFNGDQLLTGTVLYTTEPTTATLGAGLTLVVGCSVNSGPFTPYSLAPLTVPDGG